MSDNNSEENSTSSRELDYDFKQVFNQNQFLDQIIC